VLLNCCQASELFLLFVAVPAFGRCLPNRCLAVVILNTVGRSVKIVNCVKVTFLSNFSGSPLKNLGGLCVLRSLFLRLTRTPGTERYVLIRTEPPDTVETLWVRAQ
jgi:hypothetical protein